MESKTYFRTPQGLFSRRGDKVRYEYHDEDNKYVYDAYPVYKNKDEVIAGFKEAGRPYPFFYFWFDCTEAQILYCLDLGVWIDVARRWKSDLNKVEFNLHIPSSMTAGRYGSMGNMD